jgi:hypothetical protein
MIRSMGIVSWSGFQALGQWLVNAESYVFSPQQRFLHLTTHMDACLSSRRFANGITCFENPYHVANVQLVAAQAQGNRQGEWEAVKTLMRLHQSIAQVQAQRKAC